jgi:hypothetical protein
MHLDASHCQRAAPPPAAPAARLLCRGLNAVLPVRLPEEVSTTEISNELNIPRTTVFRAVRRLEARSLVRLL